MAKNQTARGVKMNSVHMVEQLAQQIADEMSLELVEVSLQKESRGKCLCIFVDKEGGLTLNDCESYHRRLQPMLEEVDYDIMEVSSPGVDRPVKNQRDFEKNRGKQVEVKLFAPLNGAKLYQGALTEMDEKSVTITDDDGSPIIFERKAVALIKPVLDLDIDDMEEIALGDEE